MDMKKILSAFDNAVTTPKVGTSDMKKFLSIISESTVAKESAVTSFEEGSMGGDVNDYLIAADHINDLVMGNLDKIKINANEQLLKDVMTKFNEFMTAYHAVGKEILQPDLFDSVNNEQVDEAGYRGQRDAYQRDYDSSVSGMGKRDSLAYQLDGGANDEGWDEPRGQYQAPQDKPVMVGMYFYNVPAGKEQEASTYGIKQTKSGKWAKTKYNTSGRNFGFQKDMADKAFGPGKFWAPKSESVAEGETMSRAAKGNEKYGKDGMKALAKAGREGASDEKLDKIRDKYDKYDEGLAFMDYFNLAEAKQKGVDGKACWDGYKRMGTKKKGGKTVDNCVPTGKK